MRWYTGRPPESARKMANRQSALLCKPAQRNLRREIRRHQLLRSAQLPWRQAAAGNGQFLAQTDILELQLVLELADLAERVPQLGVGPLELRSAPLDVPLELARGARPVREQLRFLQTQRCVIGSNTEQQLLQRRRELRASRAGHQKASVRFQPQAHARNRDLAVQAR